MHAYTYSSMHTYIIIEMRAQVGSTGSGKSSLVPQLLLDRSSHGRTSRILVTEPRRVAAVSLAHTVANMRGEEVGGLVGYRIGGDSCDCGGRTRLLYCTNSVVSQMLLGADAHIQLTNLSHVVFDEIHVGSRFDQINLACLLDALGVGQRDARADGRVNPDSLGRGRDGGEVKVRLVLMSATADVAKFRDYFHQRGLSLGQVHLPAPRFSLEERYFDDCYGFYEKVRLSFKKAGCTLPRHANQCLDLEELARFHSTHPPKEPCSYKRACKRLIGNARPRHIDWRCYLFVQAVLFINEQVPGPGHILCFLPGEKDIELVARGLDAATAPFTVRILSGSMTVESQHRALELTDVKRTILLSTDVIESCVTPSRLQVVVDSLLHRRLGGEHESVLHTLRISRAEARQRGGRAGRGGDGYVYRLAHRSFFESSTFTELAACDGEHSKIQDILLQLLAKASTSPQPKITTVEAHRVLSTFFDRVHPKSVERTFQTLTEVGALKAGTDQTSFLGSLLQITSLEPRRALLLLNGLRFGVLEHCLAIVAIQRGHNSLFEETYCDQPDEATLRQSLRAVDQRLEWAGSSDVLASLRALYAFFREYCRLLVGASADGGPHALRLTGSQSLVKKLKAEDENVDEKSQEEVANESLRNWCRDYGVSYGALNDARAHYFELRHCLVKIGWLTEDSSNPNPSPETLNGRDEDVPLLKLVMAASFSTQVVKQDWLPSDPRVEKQLRCLLPMASGTGRSIHLKKGNKHRLNSAGTGKGHAAQVRLLFKRLIKWYCSIFLDTRS